MAMPEPTHWPDGWPEHYRQLQIGENVILGDVCWYNDQWEVAPCVGMVIQPHCKTIFLRPLDKQTATGKV